jgi:hypothetical protein
MGKAPLFQPIQHEAFETHAQVTAEGRPRVSVSEHGIMCKIGMSVVMKCCAGVSST